LMEKNQQEEHWSVRQAFWALLPCHRRSLPQTSARHDCWHSSLLRVSKQETQIRWTATKMVHLWHVKMPSCEQRLDRHISQLSISGDGAWISSVGSQWWETGVNAMGMCWCFSWWMQWRVVVDFYGAWYIRCRKCRSALPECLKPLQA
jgi:hypothetical protein